MRRYRTSEVLPFCEEHGEYFRPWPSGSDHVLACLAIDADGVSHAHDRPLPSNITWDGDEYALELPDGRVVRGSPHNDGGWLALFTSNTVLTDGSPGHHGAGNPKRPECGACNEAPASQGHDACIADLPNTNNACCGHGAWGEAYHQSPAGDVLRGRAAIERMRALGGNPVGGDQP